MKLDNTFKLKDWFEESVRLLDTSRKNANKATEYLFGRQLSDDIKMILTDRGQPEQWENNISKIDKKIVGFAEDRNTQIKLFGTQREDKLTAEIFQNILIAEANANDFDDEKRATATDMRFAGVAVQKIIVEQTDETDKFGRFHKIVKAINVPMNKAFLDPYVSKKNYEDMKYIHIAYWMDKDDLYEDFGDKVDELRGFYNFTSENEIEEEYENETTRNRVLIVETWYREWNKEKKKNSWYFVFWSDNTILDSGISPFDDTIGHPFVIEALHNPKTKKGYAGIYYDVIPKQDAVNYAILRLHNMLGNIKLLVQQDSIEDIAIFKEEFNEDNAIVEVIDVNGVKEIQQNGERQQLLNIIIDGRNQIKEILGVNDEFLAMANNRMSGEAIQQRLSIGTLGLSEYLTACANIQKRTIKKMIPLVSEYYDSNRVMQIIEPDMAVRYFEINAPLTDEAGFMQYDQTPQGEFVPKVKNKLTNGKYDLTYAEMPKPLSTSTERYRQNIELMKIVQQTAPDLVPEIIPELLKDAEGDLASRLSAIVEQRKATQAQNPMNGMQMQEMQLRLAKIESEIALNQSKAQASNTNAAVEIEKIKSQHAKNISEANSKRDKLELEYAKTMTKQQGFGNGYN